MSVESMISKMESMLGTRGTPNTATNWYAARNGEYFRRAPWCDQTITWAAHQSGNYDAVCFGEDFAYTVWHAERFQRAGRWHADVAGIRRGDILFFSWEGSNRIGNIDHVGIVTGVNGRDVFTIEGNTENRCARRVRNAATIAGYGRPAYANAAPTPPTGGGTGRVPAFPAGLRPGSSRPSAKGLQKALKAAGYLAQGVMLDNTYGPQTQAAVARFHNRNPQFADRPGDPAIGPSGWAELHREARA